MFINTHMTITTPPYPYYKGSKVNPCANVSGHDSDLFDRMLTKHKDKFKKVKNDGTSPRKPE